MAGDGNQEGEDGVDLIMLVLVIALVGFLVHLITTHIPMSPIFRVAIQIIVVVVVILFLIQRFGGGIPNLMGGR